MHLQQLAEARQAARRVRRAISVARSSAWTTGIFGGVTLLGALFGDLTSLVLGSALIAVGVREGRLARRLAGFDAAAPASLAINQLILSAVIVLYAASQIWIAFHAPGHGATPSGDKKVDAMLSDIDGLTRRITVAFYLAVAIGGVLGTLAMAWYYKRRTPHVQRFVANTEPWIVDVLRTAA